MGNRKTNLIVLITISFFILWKPGNLFSQDTIITTTNKSIICKVKEVSNLVILYSRLPDTSQIKRISTSSVSKILYSNGTSDVFNHLLLIPVAIDSSMSMYEQGRRYGKLNSHFGHIALSTFLIATAGPFLLGDQFADYEQTIFAVPVSILLIAFIPPKSYSAITETYPYNDPDFRRGFDKQRRKEKKKAVLKGFTFGLVTDIAIILLANGN